MEEGAMNKPALALALALVGPLAVYEIPYAHASTIAPPTKKIALHVIALGTDSTPTASCNSGDYATGGGDDFDPGLINHTSEANAFTNPGGWIVDASNPTGGSLDLVVLVVCQTPITVAGVGGPQFGSLSFAFAIAIGAVAHFVPSRRSREDRRLSALVGP
jgi:hypothetical protein